MENITVVKEEKVNEKQVVFNMNEHYDKCEFCFYVKPVPETEDLNYVVKSDDSDEMLNVSYIN